VRHFVSKFWVSTGFAAALISLAACGGGPAAAPGSATADLELDRAPELSGEEAHQFVSYGAVLLDVTPESHLAESAIEGSTHIPMDELRARLNELPQNASIVVYCLTGEDTARAAAVLVAEGYDAHELGARARWDVTNEATASR